MLLTDSNVECCTSTSPPVPSPPPSPPARDSFDRISDYLCEDILSHLAPEQKLRLECVSQQFQRTIFRRQRRLVIAPGTNEWSRVKNAILKRFVGEYNVKHRIDGKLFDQLLAKFRHIDDVVINYNLDTGNMDELFASLMEHCIRIRRLHANFFNISERTLDQFGQVFGHSLRVIKSSYVSNGKIPYSFALLKHCSNLVSLKSHEFLSEQLWNNVYNTMVEEEEEVEDDQEEDPQQQPQPQQPQQKEVLPNLKSAQLSVTSEEGVSQLERFSDLYMNKLEKIQVELVDYIYRSHYLVNFIFPLGICKFRNLRQCLLTLKYNGGYDADFVWINNGLSGIAQDCPLICHLGIDFIGHQDFFINSCLQALPCFKTLPRLSLSVSMYNKGLAFPPMPSVQQLDLAYPRLYQCTHLKQLVQSYPAVTTLTLSWMYFFNDVLLNSLIGMKKLQRLKIGGLCPPDVTTNGLTTFLNTAPQIRSVVFDKKPKVTTKTVEMLVEFVGKRPSVYYDFDFCLRDGEPEERRQFEQYFSRVPLPKNMAIR
ncbi:hypothetical protein TYRP_011015 [Tyrophagus putrescentiae]|nr:hypothetical protein TYRP_011015 [Tyrophagus putrescentiae]